MKIIPPELIMSAISLAFFNDHRETPLKLNPELIAAATAHTTYMQTSGNYEHSDDLLDLLPDEYKRERLGEILGRYDVGVNPTLGNPARLIDDAWQRSEPHWEIIIHPEYEYVGIFYTVVDGVWWVTARFSS